MDQHEGPAAPDVGEGAAEAESAASTAGVQIAPEIHVDQASSSDQLDRGPTDQQQAQDLWETEQLLNRCF